MPCSFGSESCRGVERTGRGSRSRPIRQWTLRALLALVAAVPVAAVAQAQSFRHIPGYGPRVFAIRGATITTAPGETIEDGTLVVRGGRIAAVGGEVEIPPEAEVIDGKGLHVYAGFIDAGTAEPLDPDRQPKPAAGREVDFGRYALAATRPDNRRSLTPAFRCRDGLKTDDKQWDALRTLGFTAVHVLPKGRIAGGQGALLTTSGDPVREALLDETTFSQFELFAPGGREYPSTLMGATAHLRQALLDARHHARHRALYEAGSRDVPRPPIDETLHALNAVLTGGRRALFFAESRDDIHRALDFADEHELAITLWGAREASECIARLQQAKADLIVGVDFGEEPKIEPPSPLKELTADLKDPLRVQRDHHRRWQERVEGLSALHRAGLRFAIGSQGLKKRSELLGGLRRAISAGLDRDAALAALTVHPAAILGLDRQLGTLEPGKLAHLVVLTGPFDHEQSKVRYVFVDGHQFEYHADAKPVKTDSKAADDELAAGSVAAPVPPTAGITPQQFPTELRSDRLRRPRRTGGNVLIRHATVLTGTGQTLPETSVMVRNGKIAAVGKGLLPDAGMPVIDAAGRYLMPGIIDTHSHIMISGGINEATLSIVPEVRVRDVIDTDDITEYRALAGGVTTARLLHGSANVIGGQDAVVKLKHGTTAAEHLVADAPQGVKFALGENVKFRSGRFPNTRLGVEATLNRAFLEAIDYRRLRTEHEQAAATDGAAKLLPPRRDLRLEALADIVNGEKFIHSHCYRADEILMLLRVAEGLGVRVWSLQHVLEGYKVAPEIVAHGASCSTFSDWWAYKVEAFDAIPHNAALLHEAGADVVIKSDDWELIRHLYLEAAKVVRYGNMPPDEALQTITLNAARQLGLDDRIGSVEVGKDADLALFSGHPLNAFSRCEMTLIEGEVYFDRAQAPSAMSPEAARRSATPPELVFPPAEVRARLLDLTESPDGRYALVGATLHPVDAPVIPEGTLLVEDGRIVALGPEVAVPSGTKIIDARGLHITPGFIDAGTTLGLVEIGKVRETHDYAESGLLQPDLRAGVAVNPDSELIPVARAGGITTALVRPTGGLIAGQASLIKLAGWTAPDMAVQLEAGLQIIWPSDEKMKEDIKPLKEFFEQARHYDRVRRAAEERNEPGPIADPRLEAMRPYLRGERPVFIEAHTRRQIAAALLFAAEEKLKLVLTGGTDAWQLAGELKKRDVPVIVGPVMRRPTESSDPFDAPYANPGRLHEAGVRFCLRSDSATNSRNAPFEAAQAVAFGLPEDQALRAVTLSAAEILGLSDRTGSLTPGKQATFVIADGSPLQPTAQIKAVFLDGRPHAPESRQTRLYTRYRQRLAEMRPPSAADSPTRVSE